MRISGATQLVGLIGWPVSHSGSPAMHAAAAEALNLDLAYVPLPVRSQDLGQAIRGLAALGFLGANVTIPYKQSALDYMDELDPASEVIGAINTIVVDRKGGSESASPLLRGYNTDWSGFLRDLDEQGWNPENKECLILGAGGAARAVAYGLLARWARVTVASRRKKQGESVAARLGASLGNEPPHSIELSSVSDYCSHTKPDLIVNATPLGMAPKFDHSAWPADTAYPEGALVYDLVYQPVETKLMRDARAAGCHVSNGLGMLVQQGALAFELWTGKRPDMEIMVAALE